MPKRLLLCLMVLLLVCTSCAGQSKDVNIMCLSVYEDTFDAIHRAGVARDDALAPVNCLTEEDYTDYADWYDSMYTGLLTRSDDIDIYWLRSTDEKAYKLLKDHYFVDLSQDKAMMEYYDAMYPEIRDWCTFGDEIFGFPVFIHYPMGLFINEDQMKDVGYTREDIRTMEGFGDFCDAWNASQPTPPIEGKLFLHNYVYDYLLSHYERATGELNLDTPAFRSILAQFGASQYFEYMPDSGGWYTVELDTPIALLTGTPMAYKRQYIPAYFPLLEGESPDTKRNVSVTWCIINPSSRNKEQAFAYMRLLAEASKYDKWTNPLMYRDEDFYASAFLRGTTFNNIYSDEQFEMVGGYLDGFYLKYGFTGYGDVRAIFDLYIMDGNQTLDETIAEAQDLLDTIRQEQYIGED